MSAPKTQILPFEHWCLDGCGEIVERRNSATRVRRWKVSLTGTPYAWAFGSEKEALEFCARKGYEVET